MENCKVFKRGQINDYSIGLDDYKRDIYGGIEINSAHNATVNASDLTNLLEGQLIQWTSSTRAVWFKVNILQSEWIPVLTKHGFIFHHAKPDYVMMTKWLCTTPNSVPKYAFTTIGVGGLVISADNQILMMREQRGVYLGWKLPGGLADPGEDLYTTAEREVKEETGVEAKAESVLFFRHQPITKWDCADIYFVCVMRTTNNATAASNPPVPCAHETQDCRWFTRQQIDEMPETQIRHQFYDMIMGLLDKSDCRIVNRDAAGRGKAYIAVQTDRSESNL